MIARTKGESSKSKNPSNSEINNINKILVMNADAYIKRMDRHGMAWQHTNLWWPSFEISVWICHVKYADTYAF